MDDLPSTDAFADLVRLALEKDPSLFAPRLRTAASSVVGPSPSAAAGRPQPSKNIYAMVPRRTCWMPLLLQVKCLFGTQGSGSLGGSGSALHRESATSTCQAACGIWG